MTVCSRGRSTFAAAAAAAALLAAGAGEAAAAPGGVASADVDQSEAAIRAYWTPQRMRAAEPLDGPASPGAGSVEAPAQTAATRPDQETNPALDTSYPQRVHGLLFVVLAGQNTTCSATVVDSETRDLIVTAAHCLVIPGELSGGRGIVFADSVLFVPGYRNGAAPLGSYAGTELATPAAAAQSGDVSFDFGAVKLAPGSASGVPVQDALGARGIAFNRSAKSYRNDDFEIYGYPAAPEPDYDGERLIVCFSQFQGFETFTGAPVIAPCHQQQGSSGGGWVRNGRVESVISHAGCAIPSTSCTLISGSYFGEAEFKVYRKLGGISKGNQKSLKKCQRKFGSKGKKPSKKKLRSCKAKVQRFSEDPR